MNIVCVICSELLAPSDDVYYTPCGHIFHFACLQKWISRSNTCPQCREKTSARNIHRIYFNFSNDDSIVTDPITLQSTIDSQNFNLTLLKKEKNDLTERNSKLEMQKLSLQQEVWSYEGKIKDKNSAILALKEQLKYCKAQCANVADKEHEIKMLNTKLKDLQNVQTIINASANKVDNMIKEISSDDVCKLKTYISILKSELENSTIQKKQLREKLRTQNYSKLKQLEEILKNQDAEITHLQAKLLEMQTAACNCKCSETVAEVKNCVEECKESQGLILDSLAIKRTSNSCNGASLEIDLGEKNISADNAENTPQNIKSRGFFSMTNHKRVGNNTTVPSILAKKMKFNELASKKTVSRGMTFDGFGGHAKYDKFPNQFKNSY